jgi:predicted PurR-regulated permease PerM
VDKLTKSVLIILLVIGLVAILYFGRPLLVPVAFGVFFAMLFTPMARWLVSKNIPKIGAVVLCLLSLLLTFAIILGAVSWQGNSLAQDWPKIKEELSSQAAELEEWAITNIGIVSESRVQQIKDNLARQKKNIGSWIQNFLGSVFDMLTSALLALLFMVFIMINSERLYRFALKLTSKGDQENTEEMIESARKKAAQYFVGRSMLVGIQGVLYMIGFSVFGLQYAIPIGILAGLLTFIPYIGNIIGGGLAILVALATGGGSTVIFGILGTMTVVQVLENYILEPWIVGSEVSLNPLFTFASVIALSLVWGIAGTILAVPLAAILKTVFDHSESLRPYGYVMGLRE